jgi:hypothetical protein
MGNVIRFIFNIEVKTGLSYNTPHPPFLQGGIKRG